MDQDLHFKTQTKPILGVPLLIILAVFILACLYLGVTGLASTRIGEAIGYILFGLALVYVAERVFRHFFKPQFSLTSDAVVAQKFWFGVKVLPYAGTRSWRTETQYIDRNHKGRPLAVPYTVERLFRTDTSGNEAVAMLPRFYPENEEILKALEQRSQIAVARGGGPN